MPRRTFACRQVAKLLRRSGDEISLPLTAVIGKDPTLLPGMVANVDKLLRRTTEMETLMVSEQATLEAKSHCLSVCQRTTQG